MIDSNQSLAGIFVSCRAAALGFSLDYAECFTPPPTGCEYRQPLVPSCHHLCNHPQRDAIVEKTRQQDELG